MSSEKRILLEIVRLLNDGATIYADTRGVTLSDDGVISGLVIVNAKTGLLVSSPT